MFLVLAYTVLTRTERGFLDYGLTPFWSYKAIFGDGYSPVSHTDLFIQIIANVVMFIPIGLFAGKLMRWKGILIGLGFSVVIELIQLVAHLGLFEFDDVIHNTIGTVIGVGVIVFGHSIVARYNYDNNR